MSEYHDDSTFASNPGAMAIDDNKLLALDPELYGSGTLKCGPICPRDHSVAELHARLVEHVQVDDSQPAVVVSIDPLIVSVDSEDLDAAVLLRFPSSLVAKYSLAVGTRLVSVNTYCDLRRPKDGVPFYAVDLIPGPARSNWSNFHPVIADFVSSDRDRIARLKSDMTQGQWLRLDTNTTLRIERWGLDTARDGRPSRSEMPYPVEGPDLFRTVDGAFASPSELNPGTVLERWWPILLLAIVLGYFAFRTIVPP